MVACVVGPSSEVVVVGELGVAKSGRGVVKYFLDTLAVQSYLSFKFLAIVEKRQAMVVGFGYDFAAPSCY